MFVIMPDVVVTRRKRVHMVLNNQGDIQYSTSNFEELLLWLTDHGQEAAYIEADANTVYRLEIRRLASTKATFRVTPDNPHLDDPADTGLTVKTPQP